MVLSAGNFDQYIYTKLHNLPIDFGEELEKIIKHLFDNGVEKIYAMRPFPRPRMAGNNLKTWGVYQNIRESFDLVAKRYSDVQLLKFDALVMKRLDKKYGVFRDKNSKAAVNYILFSSAFSITHNCRVTPSWSIIQKIKAQLKIIANGLSPPLEGLLNHTQPKRLDKRLFTISKEEEEPMNVLRILKSDDPELLTDNENKCPFKQYPSA